MNNYLAEALKKHPWLEIKGDETEEQLAAKSRHQFIMSMSPAERRIFWAKEQLREDESQLRWLINELADWKSVAESVRLVDKEAVARIRRSVMQDLKKQREVVRCQRMTLKRLLNETQHAPKST